MAKITLLKEFQFQLFVKGKRLWGHLDGSDSSAPADVEALSKWKIKDAHDLYP